MNYYNSILIDCSETLTKALKVIDDNSMGIAIVVDNNKKLMGTITDGDIRRALLKNYSVTDKITDIYNKHCKYVNEKYTTEQIINVAKKNHIKILPVVNENMVVNGFLQLDDNFNIINKVKDNPVLIMAGGLGTRLKPLTDDVPKPMLKVGGKPILEIIIEQFRQKGYRNIYISVNYKSDIIKNYFRDGKDFGVNIFYIEETKRLGTAGAIKLAEKYLNKSFVINGDILTNINFDDIMEFHNNNNFDITIASRNYEMQVPYGVLNTTDNVVTSIEEKPVINFDVNGGIYVLKSK